ERSTTIAGDRIAHARRMLVKRAREVSMSRHQHMRTTHYHVDHLRFEHSDLGLERQLAQFPGVIRVAVDAQSGRVTKARLERTICDCGYDCQCAEPLSSETF
ncbi:MAG: hypothetical protein J0626_07365, partial [Rhodospirillaceae bacterium]|nr:hypothetical protein [Rhodospirillaceae bacterium]